MGYHRIEQGELVAVLDANRENLVVLDWSYNLRWSYNNSVDVIDVSFTGGSIPVLADLPTNLFCRANGAETCNSIHSFMWTRTLSSETPPYNLWQEQQLTGHTCEPDSSWIQVSFQRE